MPNSAFNIEITDRRRGADFYVDTYNITRSITSWPLVHTATPLSSLAERSRGTFDFVIPNVNSAAFLQALQIRSLSTKSIATWPRYTAEHVPVVLGLAQ
jgi:hypothetical protein